MDIVDELRQNADRMGSTHRIDLVHRAADEIVALRIEKRRLKEKLDNANEASIERENW